MTPKKEIFKDKIVCSECNRGLMGEPLIAWGGKILCMECYQNQMGKKE